MSQGQRLYLIFSRGEALRFLSHLDMMRLWVRALRRAGLPLCYSQGYHPRPRLSLALPLAVGMTAAAEWFEVELDARMSPAEVCRRVSPQLPAGIELIWVGEASWQAPALTTLLHGAEYEAEIRQPPPRERVQEKVQQFLEADTWMVEERHKGKARALDLREGVIKLEVGEWREEGGRLHMQLRHNPKGSVRPQTVLQMLRVEKQTLLHRQQLLFQVPPHVPGEEVRCSDE